MKSQNDASTLDKSPSTRDLIKAGWHLHQKFDRMLNDGGYVVGVVQLLITNSPQPGAGERILASEVFQVGDLRVPQLSGLYQHLVSAHNRTLPSEARPRNPNQMRRNGKFVKASELTEKTEEE